MGKFADLAKKLNDKDTVTEFALQDLQSQIRSLDNANNKEKQQLLEAIGKSYDEFFSKAKNTAKTVNDFIADHWGEARTPRVKEAAAYNTLYNIVLDVVLRETKAELNKDLSAATSSAPYWNRSNPVLPRANSTNVAVNAGLTGGTKFTN